ncbi:MAG: endolytic transglycosylase MltG [Lewinellaceae bacterium]|nr:endolytic transglycosylase MltG [Lewinellaceae bacterium]
MYKGLPPGPISMASIGSIDAVLNPQQHDYLYFCANSDESGTHAFAGTYAAHLVMPAVSNLGTAAGVLGVVCVRFNHFAPLCYSHFDIAFWLLLLNLDWI